MNVPFCIAQCRALCSLSGRPRAAPRADIHRLLPPSLRFCLCGSSNNVALPHHPQPHPAHTPRLTASSSCMLTSSKDLPCTLICAFGACSAPAMGSRQPTHCHHPRWRTSSPAACWPKRRWPADTARADYIPTWSDLLLATARALGDKGRGSFAPDPFRPRVARWAARTHANGYAGDESAGATSCTCSERTIGNGLARRPRSLLEKLECAPTPRGMNFVLRPPLKTMWRSTKTTSTILSCQRIRFLCFYAALPRLVVAPGALTWLH